MAQGPLINQSKKLHLRLILQPILLRPLEMLFQSDDRFAERNNQDGFIPPYLHHNETGHGVGFPRCGFDGVGML